MEIVKVPEKRIRAFTADSGETKKLIERKCEVKLQIDPEGEIEIEGECADIFFAKDVIKAIGRGFEANDALKILNENYGFVLIDLKEVLKNDKAISRIKGRIIGEKGKMKTEIEAATESKISIYGYTVGIIAELDTIDYAKEAVGKLINGAEHSRVYAYLAKMKREIFRKKLT
jgi:ribosomal RNA assembly protein